ncbi:MAG: alpha-galactosidase, partial [Planctomycetota bacterium]
GSEGQVFLEFLLRPHFLEIQSQILCNRDLKTFSPLTGLLNLVPEQTRILENGYDFYYDYYPRLIPGTEKAKSNWSALFTNLKNRSVLCSFLQYFQATAQVFSSPQNQQIALQVQLNYDPPLKSGTSLREAEPLVLIFSDSPFQCLEQLSHIFAKQLLQKGYESWTGPVPDGWCSYQGGPDFGGYGENIHQQLILENLESMKTRLKPFGMRYFQISQGWETAVGDWDTDLKKFPQGMKWLADEIRRQGFIPGLTISPFVASNQSALYRNHPDWFVPKSLAGRLGSPKECMILDISKPEIKQFILDQIRQVTKEWGFQYLKMDNTYWALFGTKFFQKDQTYSQVFVEMMKEIRKQTPPDVFLSAVGIVGLNYYFVHGLKSNLDTLPVWLQPELEWKGRGVKETYRVLARRYYFPKGLFVQDPDLIYFRKPLTSEQSQNYVQAVGYSGGMVRVGEPISSLTPQQVHSIGALLPAYHQVGTPQDLFLREYPECWTLMFKDHFHIGLFNWGENLEFGQKAPIPAGTRKQTISLKNFQKSGSYHAVEFWSENYLGIVSNQLQTEVPAYQSLSITLTPVLEVPSLIHSNRHLFLLTPEEGTSFEGNQLFFTSHLVPEFDHHWIVSVPKPWRFEKLEGLSGEVKQIDSLLHIYFSGASQSTLHEWSILFQQGS